MLKIKVTKNALIVMLRQDVNGVQGITMMSREMEPYLEEANLFANCIRQELERIIIYGQD